MNNSGLVFKNKKVGICGLGATGLSVYNYLKDKANIIAIWDDNISARENFIKTTGAVDNITDQEDKWSNIELLVLSPGVPFTFPSPHPLVQIAKKNNIQIISDIDLLYLRESKAKFIAITGTNGKSTTTALIGHIMQVANLNYEVGGNIGQPALSLAENKYGYILELSSFQLDLVKYFKANIAVFLNFTPDHLDRHGDMAGYLAAKKKIFERQTKDDFAVINIDNSFCQEIYDELQIKQINCIAINADLLTLTDKNTSALLVANKEFIINLAEDKKWPLPNNKYLQGRHNSENIMAAFAACQALGVDEQDIIKAIGSFVGLPHRMQFIGESEKIAFYNDSKATNAEACYPALQAFNNIYWLAGGVPKAGGIKNLKNSLQNVKKAYLFGEAKELFADNLHGIIPFIQVNNLEEALTLAYHDANANNGKANILLSPACASYDQYKNYAERGNHFITLVENLLSKDNL